MPGPGAFAFRARLDDFDVRRQDARTAQHAALPLQAFHLDGKP